MTDEEVAAYIAKLKTIGIKTQPLRITGTERYWNPNTCVLVNPQKLEQVDMCPERPTCEVWMYKDTWQIEVETTGEQLLMVDLLPRTNKRFFGIRATANRGPEGSACQFLGAVRFRKNNEDATRISFWYNVKR